jgi:acetate kinase
MKILVFNAGSSSLKFGIFDVSIEDSRVFKGEFEEFKNGACTLHYRIGGEQSEEQKRSESLNTINGAIVRVPEILKEFGYDQFDAIGHRVAHGWERFHNATLINTEVLKHIEACTLFAPLHNPVNLKAIMISQGLWPDLPQVTVFVQLFTIPSPIVPIPMSYLKNGEIKYYVATVFMGHRINMWVYV